MLLLVLGKGSGSLVLIMRGRGCSILPWQREEPKELRLGTAWVPGEAGELHVAGRGTLQAVSG